MPSKASIANKWKQADQLSDKIVALLQEEIKIPGFSPVMLFAGQLLALKAFMRTAPESRPQAFHEMEAQIDRTLSDMIHGG